MIPYRKGTSLDVKPVIFCLHQGGLGDLIGQLPAIKYVRDNHPYIKVSVWCHDYGVELMRNIFGDDTPMFEVKQFSNTITYDPNTELRSPYIHAISNLGMHITDHAFLTLLGVDVAPQFKNYLKLSLSDISHLDLPEKYFVVNTGFTSPVREWKASIVKEVTDQVIKEYGYTPVYLGKSYVPATSKDVIIANFDNITTSNGIDYIDRTSLVLAASIMGKAQFTIGLDNGLMHLNGMTNTKAVWGFTTVEPAHRLPYNHGIKGFGCEVVAPSYEELACTMCQSRMNFVDKDYKFTNCYYSDKKCLDLLTTEKWMQAIKKVLAK